MCLSYVLRCLFELKGGEDLEDENQATPGPYQAVQVRVDLTGRNVSVTGVSP